MRTTLDIDDDLLEIAKARARIRDTSAGKELSDMARLAITPIADEDPEHRNGFGLLPRRPGAREVTNEMIDRIREEEGI